MKAQPRIQIPDWLTQAAKRLNEVPGVVAITLGGSRARGVEKPGSDYDLGVFYHRDKLDWEKFKKTAELLDDKNSPQGLASPGEWGPWINGGGWLKIQGQSVDFLLRDLDSVAQVISDSEKGIFSSHYQIGHPNAFYSHIWMAEVHTNLRISDPNGELEKLYLRTLQYPAALKKELIFRFGFEAQFSFSLLQKMKLRDDAYYIEGLVFRTLSCLVQILFAKNETYFMNEKGSVEMASHFAVSPKSFGPRAKAICTQVPEIGAVRDRWLEDLQALVEETLGS